MGSICTTFENGRLWESNLIGLGSGLVSGLGLGLVRISDPFRVEVTPWRKYDRIASRRIRGRFLNFGVGSGSDSQCQG